MKSNKNLTIKLRLFLICLTALSLGLFAYSISYLFINEVSDKVMSMIALVVLSLFALMEITITLVNFKKPLGVEKIGVTERGNVNPIPLIATGLIAVIGLAFIIPGLIFFFSKDDEFYEYYEQFCADYHSLFNFNKMGGVSLCGSLTKHDVNLVEFVRDVLQIYKEIVRDLREKAIQNF